MAKFKLSTLRQMGTKNRGGLKTPPRLFAPLVYYQNLLTIEN